MSIKSCPVCLGEFESVNARRKYCSAPCKERGKPSANRGVCAVCGLPIQVKPWSSSTPTHHACKDTGHGTASSYKSGCRCDECRQAAASEMRDYNARHKTEHGISYNALSKRRANGVLFEGFADCVDCGEPMTQFTGSAAPVHKRCKSSYIPDYVVKRALILERDSGLCQLCFEPVDVDAYWLSDWAVTLDHVVPRSLGGGHGVDNLRLAHRWCNSARRNDVSVDALLAP